MAEDARPDIVVLVLDRKYGKLSIEPLEQGMGHTLGNAFRRVLLAHIAGATITNISIEGAVHEFSTLPGVMEDTTEIMLNLKELAVKIYDELADEDEQGTEHILRIEAEGQTEVSGADILCPPEVEIVNPELHIAELTSSDARLYTQMWVEKGMGYQPVEEREQSPRDKSIIPVDAVFSPIRRATYSVEPTRLGRRTDLERLTLEVWSNGTLMPDEAVRQAAQILQEHLSIFAAVPEVEGAAEEKVAPIYDKTLELPIEEVDFSVRVFNCLRKEGIDTLGDLITRSEDELVRIRNFGHRSLEEVVQKLTTLGLSLREPPSEEPA